jgi:hypothetical protein
LDGVTILIGVLEGCSRYLDADQMLSSLIPMLAMPAFLWDPGGALPAVSEMKMNCFMGGALGGSGIGISLAASFANATGFLGRL